MKPKNRCLFDRTACVLSMFVALTASARTIGQTPGIRGSASESTRSRAAAPPKSGSGPAVSCQVMLDGGHRRVGGWAGSCWRGKLADGLGAVRITTADGTGVFAGRAVGGLLISGITILHGGFILLSPEGQSPGRGVDPVAVATESAFRDAINGAAQASAAYRKVGNVASAQYYARMKNELVRGRPE